MCVDSLRDLAVSYFNYEVIDDLFDEDVDVSISLIGAIWSHDYRCLREIKGMVLHILETGFHGISRKADFRKVLQDQPMFAADLAEAYQRKLDNDIGEIV